MSQTPDKKTQIVYILFILPPILILSKLADVLAGPSGTPILYSALLGALGAIIGFLFHRQIKDKSAIIQVVGFIVLIALCTSIALFTMNHFGKTN